MILNNTESNERPAAVTMQRMPDGTASVRLAANIHETTRRDEDGQQTVYVYDEALFTLGADRAETAGDILASFAAWWAYASEPQEESPTVEERLSVVESALLELFGGE